MYYIQKKDGSLVEVAENFRVALERANALSGIGDMNRVVYHQVDEIQVVRPDGEWVYVAGGRK